MKIQEVREAIEKFEMAEDEREGKYFKNYRKVLFENSSLKMHDNVGSSISSGRIWNFFIAAIYAMEPVLMDMAIEKEQKDFEKLEKEAKEAAIEFATGGEIKLILQGKDLIGMLNKE